MAYRALYRQYRPRTFSELIGQEHVTTILQNQIMSGHIAHAYLFCGTRGTGKTTSAKILSRAVNCEHPENGEPCGKCPACLRASEEGCPDITEIDAASNNGVDDVRALIEKVNYAPLQLKRRVFIVDEVHMLSGSAFNALLKTLEEPPADVVFILATTEPQKLPATIISRCQRFDFHRLTLSDIITVLKNVLQKAGASIDEAGLRLIARAADGGMRDALSLADQCLSFCGDQVTEKDVYDVLGSMDQGFLFDIADALLNSDANRALHMLDGIVRAGRDLSVFCQDLSAHFRSLLLAKTCGECTDLLDCTDDVMTRYLAQAKNAGDARLLLAVEQLLKAQGEMRYLASPRTMLESTLVRICRVEDERSFAALEARLDRLEQSGVAVRTASAVPVAAKKQAPAPPASHEEELPPLPEPPPEDGGMSGAEPFAPPAAPVVRQSTAPVTQKPAAAVKAQTSVEAQAPVASNPAVLQDANALWNAALNRLQKENPIVYVLARAGAAESLSSDALTVCFPANEGAQFNSINAPINRNKIQAILKQLGAEVRPVFVQKERQPTSEADIAKARELFGDKLRIE